jgi:mannose-6-phosphate isomerase-like protein (cupin superfamily)
MTTLENARLGVRLEIRKTAEETNGELFEFDVVGRARGFLIQSHVHTGQAERHEVIEGSMRLVIEGRDHLLKQGEAMTVPVGAVHRQVPAGNGPARVRVQLRPAGDSEAFIRRLIEIDVNRLGFPRPVGAARLVRDFGHMSHAARPPMPVQRALSRAILAVTSRLHARAHR